MSYHVTIKSLSEGPDRVLARFVAGVRGLLIAQLSNGSIGIVNVTLDTEGRIEKILSLIRVQPSRLDDLELAISHARRLVGV